MANTYQQEKKRLQHELLVKIATMYYNEDLSQRQIAKELEISRSNVSKLLRTARDMNIVDIRINDISSRTFEIGERLREAYDLTSVIIAPSNIDREINLSNIGLSAAKYLESKIGENMKIGVSWGSTIYHMIFRLTPMERTNVEIIQLMGGLNWSNSYKYGIQMIMSLSERIGGRTRFMNAPLMLDSRELKELFMQETYLKKHMELVSNVDMAIIGIGTNNPAYSTMIDGSTITKEVLAELWESGVKAHLCGQHIDMDGQPAAGAFNERVITVPLETLRDIPSVIGIAGGEEKVESIVAALNGGYIDTLITDEKTAIMVNQIIQENEKEQA